MYYLNCTYTLYQVFLAKVFIALQLPISDALSNHLLEFLLSILASSIGSKPNSKAFSDHLSLFIFLSISNNLIVASIEPSSEDFF